MTSFDGVRVIAVGLNGIVLTSSNSGKDFIVQIIVTVASRGKRVASRYQCRPSSFVLCTFPLVGDTWSSQTLGSGASQGLNCISSTSSQIAMTAGQNFPLIPFFFLSHSALIFMEIVGFLRLRTFIILYHSS